MNNTPMGKILWDRITIMSTDTSNGNLLPCITISIPLKIESPELLEEINNHRRELLYNNADSVTNHRIREFLSRFKEALRNRMRNDTHTQLDTALDTTIYMFTHTKIIFDGVFYRAQLTISVYSGIKRSLTVNEFHKLYGFFKGIQTRKAMKDAASIISSALKKEAFASVETDCNHLRKLPRKLKALPYGSPPVLPSTINFLSYQA